MPLDDKHRDELHESGLSDATIEAAGFRSIEGEEVRRVLNWKPNAGPWGRGWLIPFRDGSGENGEYARFKPDFPRTDARSKKPVKYESPFRVPNRAYFPLGVIDREHDEILIAEGEKKALAAEQAGFPCVGLVGVWGWQNKRPSRTTGRGRGPKLLIDDLNAVSWDGRRVAITFDTDAALNPNVDRAARELAGILTGRGASVRIVRLPPSSDGDKVGLDDFLVARGDAGPAELRELIDAADPFKPGVDAEVTTLPMELATTLLAERFIQDNIPYIRYLNSEFWKWDGKRYAVVPIDDMRKTILRWLDGRIDAPRPRLANEVTDCLASHVIVQYDIEQPAWLGPKESAPGLRQDCIAMANGILHLPTALAGKDNPLHPHSPHWFSPTALPYAYDPEAQCPQWFKFLTEVLEGDVERVDLLAEWFGYNLSADTTIQAIMMLEGPRRSGKGTTLRMLQAVIGKDNCVNPRLTTLGETFGLWALIGKRAAICPDAHLGHRDKALSVLEILKSISGEDAIEVHRKMLPSVSMRLGVRFTLAVNELPHFGDSSGALGSRLLIIPYRLSWAGREDFHLERKLLPEAPGVFRWALEGLARLRERGRFAIPEASRGIMAEFERLSSPLKAFLEDECFIGPQQQVVRDNLWKVWVEWCEATGHQPGSREKLGVKLRVLVPAVGESRPREESGGRVRTYDGVGLRSP